MNPTMSGAATPEPRRSKISVEHDVHNGRITVDIDIDGQRLSGQFDITEADAAIVSDDFAEMSTVAIGLVRSILVARDQNGQTL